MPDEEKQGLVDNILTVRRANLLQEVDSQEQQPAKPDLAFEPVKADGSFSLLFDKDLAGLDFITQIGTKVKTSGIVSELFADEEIDPS